MRLTVLEPEFLRWETRPLTEEEAADTPLVCYRPGGSDYGKPRTMMFRAATLAEAQGIWFLHPAEFVKNGGAPGTCHVMVGFRDRGLLDHEASRDRNGAPSRWQVVSGTGFEDLVLSPSIDTGGWHGYVGQTAPGEVSTC